MVSTEPKAERQLRLLALEALEIRTAEVSTEPKAERQLRLSTRKNVLGAIMPVSTEPKAERQLRPVQVPGLQCHVPVVSTEPKAERQLRLDDVADGEVRGAREYQPNQKPKGNWRLPIRPRQARPLPPPRRRLSQLGCGTDWESRHLGGGWLQRARRPLSQLRARRLMRMSADFRSRYGTAEI